MNKQIVFGFFVRCCGMTANIRLQKQQIEIIKAEQAVLRSMFIVKVDYLNHLSGRHEYAQTLREELERLEREAGVK